MLEQALQAVLQRLEDAARDAGRPPPRLLAVSKTRAAGEVAALAVAMREADAARRPAFGENYVQEAAAKQPQLAGLDVEWHLIGHLQSNKAALAATLFDCVETVDRAKLVPLLARHRPAAMPPLAVLVQVNIDDESSKHGCAPAEVDALAAMIADEPRLALRGLMAIPAPHPDPAQRRAAFKAMKTLFDGLARRHPSIDTLSMGMSDDLELAVAEGATLVRVGTALFGPRGTPMPHEEPA